MADHEHVDADIKVSQQMTWPVLLSLITLSAGCIGIYATLVSNDRELYAGQVQLKQDVRRLEEEKRELKNEFRNDLTEIKNDIRQVRDLLIGKQSK